MSEPGVEYLPCAVTCWIVTLANAFVFHSVMPESVIVLRKTHNILEKNATTLR